MAVPQENIGRFKAKLAGLTRSRRFLRLGESAERETDECMKRHWLFRVESLARQMRDAPLFEKARLAAWPELSTAA